MKKLLLFFLAISLVGVLHTSAQVQIDHQIQMTGAGTNAKITGVQSVSSNPDAANKIYVDTAIANRAGSSLITHYIGEFYGGGIVLSVWDSAGVQHGLIADTSGDLSTGAGAVWTDPTDQTVLIGPTAESISNGKANTAAIIAQWGAHSGTAGTAAYLCLHYGDSGNSGYPYTDWYLPSILELNDYLAAARIITSILGNTKGFSSYGAIYWSSTERTNDYVWLGGVEGGGQYTDTKGTDYYPVRAVRRY